MRTNRKKYIFRLLVGIGLVTLTTSLFGQLFLEETRIVEEDLSLESWMAIPFEKGISEENLHVESWMKIPFQSDEILEIQDWMTDAWAI
jgi:hypothetical protein